MTFYYTKETVDGAYWTPDYAVAYILGPLVGAFFAANMFNTGKDYSDALKTGVDTKFTENDEQYQKERAEQFALPGLTDVQGGFRGV